jgi:hypothetical protein
MLTPNAAVADSITRFLKLTPLRDDPRHERWVRDEFDLIEALEITNQCYNDTTRMIGKPMYVGDSGFDFTEDVKRAVEENLLGCRDQKNVLLQRKRNITMYHLVIEPIIQQLSTLPHTDVLATVDTYFRQVVEMVRTDPVDPHMDDAIVAHEMVKAAVREREAIRKQQKTSRRTKKKRVVVEDVDIDTDVDTVDDYL